MAQRILKLHLALTWSIDGQHSHAAPEKIVAIDVQLLFDRIQTGYEDDNRRFGRVPGFAQDAIHCCTTFVGDGYMFAGKIKIGQCFLIVTYDMLMRSTQLLRLMYKQILA